MDHDNGRVGPSYRNPVYHSSFPDPFVLKFKGEYFAYCTGQWTDGRIFGVLRSPNLVNWEELGGAMEPLHDLPPYYWAPEVTYWNGTFYLYYSVGNETLMEIRVATSARPDGGFKDSGTRLTTQDFAIDPHVFVDGGAWHMFYATDFLDHSHIGTGVVVDRMLDPYTLEGLPTPAARAKFDWQVYDPQRAEKGGVRWHTVEGPFVLKRKGAYYMMFSGGNWQEPSYGVSFAVSESLDRTKEWRQYSDGESIFPILRTIPGNVVGPGHNSVVRGPNNRELYCVYHFWKDGSRVLAIDRMDIVDHTLFIKGASYSDEPAPFAPSITLGDGGGWRADGTWDLRPDGSAANTDLNAASLERDGVGEYFLCEFSLRSAGHVDGGEFGFSIGSGGIVAARFAIDAESRSVRLVVSKDDGSRHVESEGLPGELDLAAFHLVRVERNGRRLHVELGDTNISLDGSVNIGSTDFSLFAENVRAEFAGLELTVGFEDLFDTPESDAERLGWEILSGTGDVSLREDQLFLANPDDVECILSKGPAGTGGAGFEFATNVRLQRPVGSDPEFGLVILDERRKEILLKAVEKAGRFYVIVHGGDPVEFPLPDDHRPDVYHQLRLLKRGEAASLFINGTMIGEMRIAADAKVTTGIFVRRCEIALEMARLTSIPGQM